MNQSTTLLLRSFAIVIALTSLFSLPSNAQPAIPIHDHVVILIMENHGFEDIIGNPDAPFINSLASGNALLKSSYGLTHPSQPNYIMLFSGSNQGVTNNNVPAGIPWTTPNLGASLIQSGFTFKAYSDGLPSVGFTGASSGAYMRKHAPWTNWQSSTMNGIPSNRHRPFTDFPTNYNLLPTVSFVVPDQNHDMHDGSIADGDAWVENNLSNYINWAKTNNSLFILTFDEDDGDNLNHVVTIFAGENVEPGAYTFSCNHYDVLRTIEDMYEIPYSGNSASATPITSIWRNDNTTEVAAVSESVSVSISPNPVFHSARVRVQGVKNLNDCSLKLFDVIGNEVRDLTLEMKQYQGILEFNREGIRNGIYFYRFSGVSGGVYTGKLILE